ncbi:MAG: HAMP domain-containing histidine kinase, partial [Proteobacteria bacterium]|nr:HAMP domain-containing histidine kinase [Pseudomonadota bacterium]
EAALRALDVHGVSDDLLIVDALHLDISPYRMVIHRTQKAGTMRDLGRIDEAMELYHQTGLEVTALDGPEAQQQILQFVHWPIISELARHHRAEEANELRRMLLQAQRRVAAFHEIAERMLPLNAAGSASSAPEFIYDQYGDPPFLLFYNLIPAEGLGVALQLDQPSLVRDFLASMRRLRKHLVILDTSGNHVAGPKTSSEIALSVPFSRTLSHLRVGLYQEAIDERLESDDLWLVPLIITAFCVFLGFGAISSQLRASRQQQLLLARQREFTTRVTHELKTPLAGIRLMAENLELGAYKTDEQVKRMAVSIVDEADRLTSRVEKILATSRDRHIPGLKPFDPEEACLDAVEMWGPRMETSGVQLHADLQVTDEVLGDSGAIRDAIGCLLDNALKYKKEGVDSQVWLNLEQRDQLVVIEVIDNGLGVPKAMREQVFGRFVRVEGPNRGKSGGHGLGLFQVAQTIEAHKGTIECGDGTDGGARFSIYVPAYSAAGST